MSTPDEKIREFCPQSAATSATQRPEPRTEAHMVGVRGPHFIEPVLPAKRQVLGWVQPGQVHVLSFGKAVVIAPPGRPGVLVLSLGRVEIIGPAILLEALPEEAAALKGFHASDLALLLLGLTGMPAAWIYGSLSLPLVLLGLTATLVMAFCLFRPHRILKHSILMFGALDP